MKRFALLLFLTTFACSTVVFAQTSYTLAPTTTIVVDGKSNKSDWSVKAEEYEGTVVIQDGLPVTASLVIPIDGLKSGRSMIMDRLMKGAFNADEHPAISFRMTEAVAVEGGGLNVNGSLTMAGSTNPVTVHLTEGKDDEGHVLFTGSTELNMKDYGMDPPTAMFGALLTKPEVTIQFNLVLQK